MEYQNKAIMALIMLPMRLRRPILLILLMIAALMIRTKTVLPNRMHPKMPSYVTKTKNNLEKMRRTKCLTRYSYIDENIKKEYEKSSIKKNVKNDT